MTFEYLIDNLEHIEYRYGKLHHPERLQGAFIALGRDSWELVSVDNGIAYFKRPLQLKSEAELLDLIDSKQAYSD